MTLGFKTFNSYKNDRIAILLVLCHTRSKILNQTRQYSTITLHRLLSKSVTGYLIVDRIGCTEIRLKRFQFVNGLKSLE